MADKQVTYPIGLIPSWANDENMNDPGKDWDATPTKVEPGAGKRDDGYLPGENPPAQHLNHKFNEIGKWIQYFSTMQVMNWFDSGLLAGSCTGEAMVYDEGIASWIYAGRADIFTNSRDQWTFASGFNSGTAQTWTWGASKIPGDAPTHTGAKSLFGAKANSTTSSIVEFTGSFSAQALPGTGLKRSTWGVWDRVNQLWLIGGVEDAGGTPTTAMWYAGTPISGGVTKVNPTMINSLDIVHMAHGVNVAGGGGALNVAVGDGNAPNFDVLTSTNGTTWSVATPTGITAGENARSIMYDPAREVWVLLTNKSCYTSTNGTAWSNVATLTTGDFQYRCLASDGGGLYVAANEFGSPVAIRYSNDGGVTWRVVPVPPSENGSTDPIHNVVYSRVAAKFGIVWVDDPTGPPVNAANFSHSLGIGETINEVDGVSIPKATP